MPAEQEPQLDRQSFDIHLRLDLRSKLRSWWTALHAEQPLQKAVETAYQDFIETCQSVSFAGGLVVGTTSLDRRYAGLDRGYAGLAMIIPSTVGVPAATSSITSLRRSPPAATHASAGVLSSEGVTPAVPPA